jgi:hypothetical protein
MTVEVMVARGQDAACATVSPQTVNFRELEVTYA